MVKTTAYFIILDKLLSLQAYVKSSGPLMGNRIGKHMTEQTYRQSCSLLKKQDHTKFGNKSQELLCMRHIC